jgi:hypothetical protein
MPEIIGRAELEELNSKANFLAYAEDTLKKIPPAV